MSPASPRFYSAALSDQGPVRPNNEDRIYTDETRGIFLVVDGMGGHEAGEHAAEIAVETLRARLERQTGTVEQRLREAITLANNGIYQQAQKTPAWNGMACVLTAAVIDGDRATVGHVGDSRCYRLKRGSIEKITHDHSPVGEREDAGEITEEDAMRHPRRNEVFRDVGTEPRDPDDDEFIEIREIPFEADSALLLCSDGLTDAVSSREIQRIVEQRAGDRAGAVRALIDAAYASGKDNISVVLVAGDRYAASVGAVDNETTARPEPTRSAGRPFAWAAAGLVVGALLAAGALYLYTRSLPPQVRQPVVVSPPSTLGEALAKAQPGDVVIAAPGQYVGPIQLKEGVDLVAQQPGQSVIAGPVSARGLKSARLEGFQIRGGDVGVAIVDSDIAIARCEITENRGAGISISGNARPSVVACRIHKNGGPGIVVEGSAAPAIEHNTIADNGRDAPAPGLLIRSSVRPVVRGNVFGAGSAPEAVWAPAEDASLEAENTFRGFPPRARVLKVVPGAGKE
jgi:parallel beta-helix repeat protein